MRGGSLLNIVALQERDDWKVEGWNVAGTTDEVLNDLRGWHPDLHAVFRAVDVPYKWALALRPTMNAWSKGRCTLLGDACHPMVPFLAQGAVMALEDGIVAPNERRDIELAVHGLIEQARALLNALEPKRMPLAAD